MEARFIAFLVLVLLPLTASAGSSPNSTIDMSTGQGFATIQDVAHALTTNSGQVRKIADQVQFTAFVTLDYQVLCDSGAVTDAREYDVNTLADAPAVTMQPQGFVLQGYTSRQVTQPDIAAACGGGSGSLGFVLARQVDVWAAVGNLHGLVFGGGGSGTGGGSGLR
jgi:hypothetical protein